MVYLGGSCDGSNLRVEVGALREVLYHHRAGVVQQRLLMDRVLHLWNLLQVRQLKAFSLVTLTHTHAQKQECIHVQKM